ncbi:MAG: Gfo/Idh/MocA family oxidoreductase [Verrucomicrobia bacterium]|nr:Gfo/Idh/MocA family oxidoreductase [Verrucomicrobiota bacterium]
MMKKTNVAIVGCGNISGIYFENLCKVFKNVTVKACADLDPERTAAKVEKYPDVQVATLEAILADPEIEIIVNLTTPQGHFPVAMQAIEAGKSVHNEKPVVLTRDEGKQLLAAATTKGVRVGSAPDTFMGGGIQTCRKLIDDGWIGDPIGAQAFMLCHGHESWHPDPEFYYKVGGGPMFDMGPYYVTALVSLLGPVKRVSGSTRITFPQRTITSAKKYGNKVDVDVPTHVTGIMDFASGAIGTITTSFDVWGSDTPCIEIFGTEGSLSVPDPNTFGGVPRVKRMGADAWSDLPLTHGYAENARGIGPADMAAAIENDRPHRANGELAYHVLDIMHAVHDSSDQGQRIELESTCERPAPLPAGLLKGMLD